MMSTLVLLDDDDTQAKYWALALYFSGLWAFFFYGLVKPKDATTKNMLICFFGTGIISMPIMLGFYEIEFFADMHRQTGSEDFAEKFIGTLFGVAILEEACKLAVLVVIWKWFSNAGISVRTYMFYGLMSGLGFGVYEGVMYQSEVNNDMFDRFDFSDSNTSPEEFKQLTQHIYIMNVLRLTSLPFLHAIYCAIAAFFFGLSTKYGHRWLLIGSGLAVPSLIHAGYNSLSEDAMWAATMLDAFAIVALLVYWRNQAKIERSLN